MKRYIFCRLLISIPVRYYYLQYFLDLKRCFCKPCWSFIKNPQCHRPKVGNSTFGFDGIRGSMC